MQQQPGINFAPLRVFPPPSAGLGGLGDLLGSPTLLMQSPQQAAGRAPMAGGAAAAGQNHLPQPPKKADPFADLLG